MALGETDLFELFTRGFGNRVDDRLLVCLGWSLNPLTYYDDRISHTLDGVLAGDFRAFLRVDQFVADALGIILKFRHEVPQFLCVGSILVEPHYFDVLIQIAQNLFRLIRNCVKTFSSQIEALVMTISNEVYDSQNRDHSDRYGDGVRSEFARS